MSAAPSAASAKPSAIASTASPSASTTSAMRAVTTGPSRSGRPPSSRRTAMTLPAKTVKTLAEPSRPCASRPCRTRCWMRKAIMNPSAAQAVKPTAPGRARWRAKGVRCERMRAAAGCADARPSRAKDAAATPSSCRAMAPDQMPPDPATCSRFSPSTGPSARPTHTLRPNSPSARPRSRRGASATTQAVRAVATAALPAPKTMRPAASASTGASTVPEPDGALAEAAASSTATSPIALSSPAASSTRRAPIRSASTPAIGMAAIEAMAASDTSRPASAASPPSGPCASRATAGAVPALTT